MIEPRHGRLHTHEETAALVEKLRAEGKLPPRWAARVLSRSTPTQRSQAETTNQSGIGDCVKAEFAKMGAHMSKGCSCEALRNA